MQLLRQYWSTDRNLSLLLVSLGLVIFVINPLQGVGIGGRLLITLFFSFMMLSAVATVAKSRTTTVLVGTLVGVTLTVRWLRVLVGGGTLTASDAVSSALFCAIMAVVVLAQTLRPGPVTAQRIQGAVAFYLLLGLAWAFVYELVDLRVANAFSFPASASPQEDPTARYVYFSFVTLTTVGFGDVTAVHPMARSLVTLEALVGQLFPAVLLARLVALEVQDHRGRDRNYP